MRHLVNGVETDLGEPGPVQVSEMGDRLLVRGPDGLASAAAVRKGDEVWISYRGRVAHIQPVRPGAKAGGAAATGEARAPMPGQIVDVSVSIGDTVEKGQKLLVLEAMKMQQPVLAPFDGTVDQLPVAKGDQVGEGDLLVHVQPSEPQSG